jgi:hypothetical protein
MSDVTNIKTITNNLLYPVTVKNGENTQQTFTVGQETGWNGDLWIPWVFDGHTMWKSILLEWSQNRIYIFQHGDHIRFSWDNNFDHRETLGGNSGIKGEKALIIASNNNIYLA